MLNSQNDADIKSHEIRKRESVWGDREQGVFLGAEAKSAINDNSNADRSILFRAQRIQSWVIIFWNPVNQHMILFLEINSSKLKNAFPTPPKSHLMASKHSLSQFILGYSKCYINSKRLSTWFICQIWGEASKISTFLFIPLYCFESQTTTVISIVWPILLPFQYWLIQATRNSITYLQIRCLLVMINRVIPLECCGTARTITVRIYY